MGKSHSRQQNQHEPLLQKENRDKRSPPPKVINVALIGGGDVGKSALVVQFVSNQFLVDYDPTIEEQFCFCFVCFVYFLVCLFSCFVLLTKWIFSYRKVIQFDGEEFLFNLLGLFFSSRFRNTKLNDSFPFL